MCVCVCVCLEILKLLFALEYFRLGEFFMCQPNGSSIRFFISSNIPKWKFSKVNFGKVGALLEDEDDSGRR